MPPQSGSRNEINIKFGTIPIDDACGTILAHALKARNVSLRKGQMLTRDDIEQLQATGNETGRVASLTEYDIIEDVAADKVSQVLTGLNINKGSPSTGRVNLFSTRHGVLIYDRDRVDQLNMIDGSVTVATLPPGSLVEAGQMVATIKIIPYGIEFDVLTKCEAIGQEKGPLLSVAAFTSPDVGLIQTTMSNTTDKVLKKTATVTARRVERLSGRISSEERCDHDTHAIAEE